jgi:hypothetical protein
MPTFYDFSTANQSEVRMDSANNKQQRNPVILIAGIVATLFCSAGVATIRDWGVSPEMAAEHPALVALFSGGDANRGAVGLHDTHDAVGAGRPMARCAGCGVIESILVIDMRDETTGDCAAGNWVDHSLHSNALVEPGSRNLATLAEIVADVIVRNASGRNVQSARYELTIRLRDGTRSTVRLASEPQWKLGERVLVINNQT